MASGKGWRMSLVGLKGTTEKMQQVKTLLNSEEVQDALLPAAMLVRDTAKRLVREGPGKRRDGSKRKHLRDLIFATKGKRRGKGILGAFANVLAGDLGPNVIIGVDRKQAPHAHLVEFGTAKMPARPYLRPAVAVARPLVVAVIENGLKRLLKPFNK
jgi:HK97 gp10 family phage protein